MKEKISVPNMGESVSSGVVAVWLKTNGETVKEGDELFELETDKATLAVPSTVSGVLFQLVEEGAEVTVGEVVAEVDTTGSAPAQRAAKPPDEASGEPAADGDIETAPAAETPPAEGQTTPAASEGSPGAADMQGLEDLSPAVRRIVVEHNLYPASIKGSGKDGRITKADAMAALSNVLHNAAALPDTQSTGGQMGEASGGLSGPADTRSLAAAGDSAVWQHKEKMTSLRKRIAVNLVSSKQASAHLTTFNEIDMSVVSAVRSEYRDAFEEKHGVRLGFMSFFVKASASALSAFPVANAMVDGDEIIYNDRYNIGVAVSTERGLIVPVVKDADRKSFAQIETEISTFATAAREKRISVDDLTGGTFSITNGGIFGSLLSTPIPTPPQSAILGMHAIQRRPVAAGEEVVIRPMMYVALTYDHRIMDGRDAVSLLVRIKKLIEDPQRLLLEL